MTVCETLVCGDPNSRKGTNRWEPCTHPAKLHVLVKYPDGWVFERNVCGIHARRHVNAMHRREGYAARWGEEAFPRIYHITEVKS